MFQRWAALAIAQAIVSRVAAEGETQEPFARRASFTISNVTEYRFEVHRLFVQGESCSATIETSSLSFTTYEAVGAKSSPYKVLIAPCNDVPAV